MVAIAVILALLALREIASLTRRARHNEAVTNLGEIFDATAAYFHERRPSFTGDPDEAPHRCPHPLGRPGGGEAGFTPSLAVVCSDSSTGACSPGGAASPGDYALTEWTNNPMWISIGRVMTGPHYFHYDLITDNTRPDDYGACTFTVIVRGDDEGDPCNEFRRVGYATVDGVIAGPLEGCEAALAR